MALRHVARPLWGVQFHPESICTEYGIELMKNFLSLAGPARKRREVTQPTAPPVAANLKFSFRKMPLRHPVEVLFRGLFGKEPYAFWLDSSRITERSRFSYMGAARAAHTGRPGEKVLDWLEGELSRTRVEAAAVPFPFTGGYVGYFGYELKAECGSPNKHQSALPDSVLLRVDCFLAVDHFENALYAAAIGEDAEPRLDAMERGIKALDPGLRVPPANAWPNPVHRFGICRQDYLNRIRSCLALIQAGESYELCLTNKVLLETDRPALDYYERLRRTNPAPYSAYLNLERFQISSSSPECFLRIDEKRRAESRPIKGTMRRGGDAAEDAALRDLLARDPRFRAENLMIVDLVRHDLARVCVPGSVSVPRLMEVETYPTLHQLVSTISGQLAPETTAVGCLRSLFPGGSMTGAPKLRTLELLDELEPDARGVYSGSIGYLGFNGAADLSIVIRTAVFDRGRVSFGVGGAIVAQSDPEAEWDEMELKAQALLRAFDSSAGPGSG